MARLGSVGGLSQPRRDSADPEEIDYLLFSIDPPLAARFQIVNFQWQIVNSRIGPVRQSVLNAGTIPDQFASINCFSGKMIGQANAKAVQKSKPRSI
jgi:hypothetical protein